MKPVSLAALRRAFASGTDTPDRALARSFDAIAQSSRLAAFVHVAERPAVPGDGPLAGIAVGVKDIIDTADMPTAMGCAAIYGGWRPKADAPVVSTLRGLGATPAGKTATTAFAFSDPAATLNPHDASRTPGGSSSGSAAAVAAGLVPLALGTQTAGSVIRPAAFCGVAAVKPSFRLLPTVGVKTAAWTLDTLGLFAAGVEDLVEALALISGRPMATAAPGGLRFAVVRQEHLGPAEPVMAAALDAAAEALRGAGCAVAESRLSPELAEEADAAHAVIMGYEMREALAWEWRERQDDLPPVLRARLAATQAIDAAAYDRARAAARRARLLVRDLFGSGGADLILTYAAPGPAPTRDTTGDPRFNRLFTLLGLPCVAVPGLRSPEGLPLGIQVVGPFARDAQTLAAAAVLEHSLRRAGLAQDLS